MGEDQLQEPMRRARCAHYSETVQNNVVFDVRLTAHDAKRAQFRLSGQVMGFTSIDTKWGNVDNCCDQWDET